MTRSMKRSRSRFEWFRMDVPHRHRARVGKTSWQESLHTTDPTLAAIRRAELSARYKRLVHQLDGENAAIVPESVAAYVDTCLRRLAECNGGSIDQAVAGLLAGIADKVRASWSPDDARAVEERRCAGADEDSIYVYDDAPVPLLVFDREQDRELYLLREKLLERQGVVDGLVYRELAGLLRQRQMWQAAPLFLLPFVVPDEGGLTDRYPDLVAETLFTRLVEHAFESWPKVAALAFSTEVPSPPVVHHLPAETLSSRRPHPREVSGPTVSEAFAAWRAHTKARVKSQDEFGSAIRRFIAAFGDMSVATIDRKTAREFRNLLQSLPAQAPKPLRDLPPREQAARADAEKLRRLSPTTVKKQLQALYTTLSHARDEMDASVVLDVFGVSVDCSEIMGDERLPFSGEQLGMLFSTPLMTEPRDEHAAFWFMLLGPLTGCRIEEVAQLRPNDIRTVDAVTFIDICRESVRERRKNAAEGQRGKGVKTRTSLRRIPLHPILIEAGFLDLVENAKVQGAEWMFDLRSYDRYEQRGKYMSNKLNRVIDAAGITEPEYVYHSFRHSMKQALRNVDEVKEEISDLLTGHSFAVSVGRKYGRGAGLRTLDRAISRIRCPDVDWAAVTSCAQARLLRIGIQSNERL